jgi:hypothetical protein
MAFLDCRRMFREKQSKYPGRQKIIRGFLLILMALPALGRSACAAKSDTDGTPEEWAAIPEDPAMRPYCENSLKYSSNIAAMKMQGASLAILLRWAEQVSEKVGTEFPADPLLPIGTDLVIIRLIQRSYLDEQIYRRIPGGFPQWVYRSCLKGKS